MICLSASLIICSKVEEILFPRRPFELLFFLLLGYLYMYFEIIVSGVVGTRGHHVLSSYGSHRIFALFSCSFNVLCDKKQLGNHGVSAKNRMSKF